MELSKELFQSIETNLETLNKRNYNSNRNAIFKILGPLGFDGYSKVLVYLVDNTNFQNRVEKDEFLILFLRDMLFEIKDKSMFQKLIQAVFHQILKPKNEVLDFFQKELRLSLGQLVLVGLSLCEDTQLRKYGVRLLRSQMEMICRSGSSVLETGVTHQFLTFISDAPEFSKESEKIIQYFSHRKDDNPNKLKDKFHQITGANKGKLDFKELIHDPVSLLETIGYVSTSSKEILSLIFETANIKINEKFVAMCLIMMCETIEGGNNQTDLLKQYLKTVGNVPKNQVIMKAKTWNIEVFSDLIKELAPKLIPDGVIRNLDYRGFKINPRGVFLISTFYKRVKGNFLPAELFLSRIWSNKDVQLTVIAASIENRGILNWHGSTLKQVNLGDLISIPNIDLSSPWKCINIIDVLLKIVSQDNFDKVSEIFKKPVEEGTLQVLIGLVEVSQPGKEGNHMRIRLVSQMLIKHLAPNPINKRIFEHLVRIEANVICQALIEIWKMNNYYLPQIYVVVHDLDIIKTLIHFRPYSFALSLVLLASRNNIVQLGWFIKQKISKKINPHYKEFVVQAMKFIVSCAKGKETYGLQVLPKKSEIEEMYLIMKDVEDHKLSQKVQVLFKQMGFSLNNVQNTIDQWSTKFFQDLFNGRVSVEERINDLKELKESNDENDQAKYAYAVHNLFDEYRFFGQYPPHVLKLVSQFFGQMVDKDLFSGRFLNYALLIILKALNSQNEQLFTFGKVSFEQFLPSVDRWPQFITYANSIDRIKEIKGFEKFSRFGSAIKEKDLNLDSNPQLDTPYVDISKKEKKEYEETIHVQSPRTEKKKSKGQSIMEMFSSQIKYVKPPEHDVEQFQFIMNNLSDSNLKKNTETFKSMLEKKYYTFYAFHTVVTRAMKSNKFHEIYVQFLWDLENEDFYNIVLGMVYRLTMISFVHPDQKSAREILKNLGNWIGRMTLTKNKPILMKDLDLKELLILAYERGRLENIVTFVARVLLNCKYSIILKPPNPWIMSIIALLVEIYHIPDLKNNIKMDIDLLCKTLEINLVEVETREYLKNRQIYDLLDNTDIESPDTLKRKLYDFDLEKLELKNYEQLRRPELINEMVVKKENSIFTKQPELRQLIAIALEHAVKEVIEPVVKRSVTIASRTTSELVTKDFHMEKSLDKPQKASLDMMTSLSTALALVTSKDPLKVAMEKELKSLMEKAMKTPDDEELKNLINEQAPRIAQDNLHLGSFYIEKAAVEKAKVEGMASMSKEWDYRTKYQQSGNGAWTGYHVSYQNIIVPELPDALLPKRKIGDLQVECYNEFGRLQKIQRKKNLEMSHILIAKDEIEYLTQQLEEIAKKESETEASIYIEKICKIVRESKGRNDIAVDYCKGMMLKFYGAENQFFKDCYRYLIGSIVNMKEVEGVKEKLFLNWNTLGSNYRFSPETIKLLEVNVFYLNQFETCVVDGIEKKDALALEFALLFIKEVISKKKIKLTQISKVFAALNSNKSFLSKKNQEQLISLMKYDPNKRETEDEFNSREIQKKRRPFTDRFREWTELYISRKNVGGKKFAEDVILDNFVTHKLQNKILKSYSEFTDFCRVVMTIIIKDYKKNIKNNEKQLNLNGHLFLLADAFSSLIGVLYRMSNNDVKVILISKTLNVIFAHLSREHEKNFKKFHQRIYLRLFSSLLITVTKYDNTDKNASLQQLTSGLISGQSTAPNNPKVNSKQPKNQYTEVYALYYSVLSQLEPSKYPGFAFSWVELISHRYLMPRLLLSKNALLYKQFHDLYVLLLKFLKPHLEREETLPKPLKEIYTSCIKIGLILLHDFSEFLCVYHHSLCDHIPQKCIQLRNLVLSAFPRHLKLPDPFTSNMKVDKLPDCFVQPRIFSEYKKTLEKHKLLTILKDYVSGRKRDLISILSRLKKSGDYNIKLINAMVLFCGVSAKNEIDISKFSKSNIIRLFRELLLNMNTKGRYFFINACVNQLRYPNTHTHYFSCAILWLFNDVQTEKEAEEIQEQITRVLLERLIVYKPHPWGLLITFIELVKNPRYSFWNKAFIHCAPQIERLFTNVGKSCIRQ